MELTTISSIIGIAGGILGLYSFIDNYLLLFRPIIRPASLFYLAYRRNAKITNENIYQLQSIICKLDIFNHRNKLGKLEDFSIDIFNRSELTPEIYTLFPTFDLESFPLNPQESLSCKKTAFTPKSIIQKSNKELSVEFCPEKYSTINLNPAENLCITLRYRQFKNRWVKIGTYSLKTFNSEPTQIEQQTIHCLSYWELDVSRSKLKDKNKVKHTNTSIYRGISDFYLSRWIKIPYYKSKKLISTIIDLYRILYYLLSNIITLVFNKIIIIPLMQKKGSKTMRLSFSRGNKIHSDKTKKTIDTMYNVLNALIEKININSSDDAKIYIYRKKDNRIILTRFKGQVAIYASGEGFITIQNYKNDQHSDVLFSLRLRDFPFGIKLWEVNNRKIIFINTICVNTLDYLIFHSNY